MVDGKFVPLETALDADALLGAPAALETTGVELTTLLSVVAFTLEAVEVFVAEVGVWLLAELAVEAADVAAELEID